MNKLQATLANFQGKMLIPLNYVVNYSKVEMVPIEGYMYIEALVAKDSVEIPNIKFSISKQDLFSFITKKDVKLPLVLFLSKFIQSDPELLAMCKHHRLGYNAELYPTQPKTVPSKSAKKQEEAFIIKVLKKKKDWVNLKNFMKTISTKKIKFRKN
jgi:hypothetical protein